MADSGRDEDEIGYKRPPKHNRFKKGQSGNPKGRPKNRITYIKALSNALYRVIEVTNDGQRIQMTVMEALVQTQVAQALKGNHRAIESVMKLIPTIEPRLADDFEITELKRRKLEDLNVQQLITLYKDEVEHS